MINIKLPDGSNRQIENGSTVMDLAKSISRGLAKEATNASIGGRAVDLSYVLKDGDQVAIHKFGDENGTFAFRHTTAHMLAQAVKRIWPDAKLAIGPPIENGFYYDFDLEHKFVPEDLAKIESEMKKISKENLTLEKFVLPRDEALDYLEKQGEIYKVELVENLPEDEEISFYQQGEFVDLCGGTHVPTTGFIKNFKLMNLAGAYWRGDEKNKMLQRIYGTAFPKLSELEQHLEMIEEAKKRDHRKLGKELKLFTILEEGPGFPFFLPHGMVVINELKKYWRELHVEAGYDEIETPIMLSKDLWETSGHWDHYRENMYDLKIDDYDFAVKPMNCPGCMLAYKTDLRSYRDFPMRWGELGRVHRHELSGALHGLMRVRAFTQDDAHIFMLPSQIKEEIKGVCRLADTIYKKLGFNYHIELSTKPEDSMGSEEEWKQAEDALEGALVELGVDYKLNPGDGAFYGPKIDFHLRDSMGRTWQCGTIQLDMQLPRRFDLSYIGADGERHVPIVIHRALYGSLERFFANVLEEHAGRFPVWLAPVQVKILTIADRHIDYAKNIAENIKKAGLRVDLDIRTEKIGYKIREAQMQKLPYMLIIGDSEIDEGVVSVRSRDIGEVGKVDISEFIEKLGQEYQERNPNTVFTAKTKEK